MLELHPASIDHTTARLRIGGPRPIIKFLLLTHTTFGGAAAKWTLHRHMNTLRQMLVWTKVGLADVLYAVGSTVTILAQLDLHTLAHA